MGDWLGTGTIAFRFRKHRPFQEAREFARSLNLKSHAEWDQFCKGQMPEKGALPPDIPVAPGPVYINKGWLGMGDWLGTGIIATSLREFRCFDEAREFARSLSLKSMREWKMFCKGQMPEKGALPQDIPTNPNRTYFNNGWIGVGDWLGTGTIAPRLREYRTFEQARTFARSLNLKSGTEWRLFCKGHIPEKGLLPCDIPASPLGTYINKGWKGYGDWLGTGAVAPRLREYRHYQEARAFVHSLNLNSRDEWRAFCRGQMAEKGALPPDIPANPNQTYAKSGWMGMSDWLGRNKP